MIIRERKEGEFIYLKQKTLTVTQYEIQFTKLSRYIPEIVNTKEKRRRRFLQGLNVEIQDALVTARIDTYAKTVEYAQRVEDSQVRLKEVRKSMRKKVKRLENLKEKVPSGLAEPQQTGFGGHSKKRPNEASTSISDRKKKPQARCHYCRLTNHTESECWKKVGKCSECGNSEHPTEKCPVTKEEP